MCVYYRANNTNPLYSNVTQALFLNKHFNCYKRLYLVERQIYFLPICELSRGFRLSYLLYVEGCIHPIGVGYLYNIHPIYKIMSVHPMEWGIYRDANEKKKLFLFFIGSFKKKKKT